jgi:HK97 gp10 family phage protein
MTTGVKLDLDGMFDDMLKDLEEMGKNVDKIAPRALLAGAKVIHAEMLRLAPEDTHNLKDHIIILGPEQIRHYHYVFVGIPHDIRYTDEETAIYANVQEYGSAHTPAHSYIVRADKRMKDKALSIIDEMISRELDG